MFYTKDEENIFSYDLVIEKDLEKIKEEILKQGKHEQHFIDGIVSKEIQENTIILDTILIKNVKYSKKNGMTTAMYGVGGNCVPLYEPIYFVSFDTYSITPIYILIDGLIKKDLNALKELSSYLKNEKTKELQQEFEKYKEEILNNVYFVKNKIIPFNILEEFKESIKEEILTNMENIDYKDIKMLEKVKK